LCFMVVPVLLLTGWSSHVAIGPLKDPKHRHGADKVSRWHRKPLGLLPWIPWPDSRADKQAHQPQHCEHGTDKQQLTQFDTDIEERQGQRYRVFRQADLPKCRRKAQAMQQTEHEGYRSTSAAAYRMITPRRQKKQRRAGGGHCEISTTNHQTASHQAAGSMLVHVPVLHFKVYAT
jgi:hypothetical protein